jgi:chromosome segregation ATPase
MKRPGAIFLFVLFLWASVALVRPVFAQPAKMKAKPIPPASEAQIQNLEKRLLELDKELKNLSRERRKLKSQLKELNRDIGKLKAQKDRGFLSNAKLQSLLADQLEVSKKIEGIDEKIRGLKTQKTRLVKRLQRAFESRIDAVVRAMDTEKDRNKSLELTREYFRLREWSRKYRPTTPTESDLGAFSIVLDPLDGPREISEKIDQLNDRISKLQQIIRAIDREIKRLEKEKNLAEEMQQMVEERNLFEEGVVFAPSPRALPVRPDTPEGGSEGDAGYNEAGVHTSPVESAAMGGRGFMVNAINKEIKRLQEEKKALKAVILGLQKKIKEFREEARRISAGQKSTGKKSNVPTPPKD